MARIAALTYSLEVHILPNVYRSGSRSQKTKSPDIRVLHSGISAYIRAVVRAVFLVVA